MVQAQLSTLTMGLGDGTLNTTGPKGGFLITPFFSLSGYQIESNPKNALLTKERKRSDGINSFP